MEHESADSRKQAKSRKKRIVQWLLRFLLLLSVTTLNIACDRVTKEAAGVLEGRRPISYLSGVLMLGYAENKGAFLSAGSSLPDTARTIILIVVPAAFILAVALYTLLRKRHEDEKTEVGETIAVACLLGGGGSNIWDRIFNHGRVIDFLNLGIGPVRTGIFNAADLSILLGCGILLVVYLKSKNRAAPPEKDPGFGDDDTGRRDMPAEPEKRL